MEGGGGGSGRRRVTLLDQMSAGADSRDLAGLTLDDVLGAVKRPAVQPPAPPPPPPPQGRTLLDIIRDEEPKSATFKGFSNKDRKAWKSFKDRLRLKRAGTAWTPSAPIPASDILSHHSLVLRHNPLNFHTASLPTMAHSPHDSPAVSDILPPNNARPQMSRRGSTRFADDASGRPQASRRLSVRFADDNVADQTDPPLRDGSRRLSAALADERSLSAREAVAAQEAAEAEAAASAAATAAAAEEEEDEDEDGETAAEGEGEPVRMSLMDLLEETDRQMGFVGSRYMMGDEDDDDDGEEEEEEDEEEDSNGVERNCCVCMVRHKGAAFIPCGHTFCRLCSRELYVSRGNCPLCNGFILEILDIF